MLVLAFTEVTSGPERVQPSSHSQCDLNPVGDDRDESTREGTSQTTTVDPDSSSQTSSEEETAAEEELLVASIEDASRPRTLAASFLELSLTVEDLPGEFAEEESINDGELVDFPFEV